LGCVILLKTSL